MNRLQGSKIDKLEKEISETKVKCVCSHTFMVKPTREKTVCPYCYRTVDNTTISRFRYMFYKTLENRKNEVA